MTYSESDYLDAVAYLDKQAKRDRKHRELNGVERYMTSREAKLLLTTRIKINNYQKINMQANQLLSYMAGQTTYQTTRGTTGDADGLIVVDRDIIDEFGSAKAIPVNQLQNQRAKGDIMSYIASNLPDVDISDLYVAEVDNTFLLLWTD